MELKPKGEKKAQQCSRLGGVTDNQKPFHPKEGYGDPLVGKGGMESHTLLC